MKFKLCGNLSAVEIYYGKAVKREVGCEKNSIRSAVVMKRNYLVN